MGGDSAPCGVCAISRVDAGDSSRNGIWIRELKLVMVATEPVRSPASGLGLILIVHVT